MATNDTFELTIAGRVITFKRTDPAQVMMLSRYVGLQHKRMDDADEAGDAAVFVKAMKAMNDATWTAVESRFIDPDDLDFVQMKIIEGVVTQDDLIPILRNGIAAEAADDDADPGVNRAAKRAAKKAVKKAVKKAAPKAAVKAAKTASPRRATR